MEDRHWLRVVEAVLRAETGNLRELAQLAGADPRTLFIGTSMDGADLRGQDLRGMRFTHLDLNRVKRDWNTKLDSDHAPEEQVVEDGLNGLLRPRALVLWVSRRVTYSGSRKNAIGPGIEVFSVREYEDFRSACSGYDVPRFIVIDEGANYSERTPPIPPGGGTTVFILRRGNYLNISDDDIEIANSIGAPVVFLPIELDLGISTFEVVRAAANLHLENSPDVGRLIHSRRISALLYAKGTLRGGGVDAWCRILSLAVRSNLLGYDGVQLVHGSEEGLTGAQILALRQDMIAIDMAGVRAPSSAAAWLLWLGRERESPSAIYGDTVLRLMRSRGWEVLANNPSQQRPDFQAVGRVMSIGVDVKGLVAQDFIRKVSYHDLKEVDLHSINRIIFDERSAPGNILSNLIMHRALTVRLNDAQYFTSESASMWNLFANQILRIARHREVGVRTSYLAAIVRCAVLRDFRVSESLSEMAEYLERDDFVESFELRASQVSRYRDSMSAYIKLYKRGRGGGDGGLLLSFRLIIDEFDGPAIADAIR